MEQPPRPTLGKTLGASVEQVWCAPQAAEAVLGRRLWAHAHSRPSVVLNVRRITPGIRVVDRQKGKHPREGSKKRYSRAYPADVTAQDRGR